MKKKLNFYFTAILIVFLVTISNFAYNTILEKIINFNKNNYYFIYLFIIGSVLLYYIKKYKNTIYNNNFFSSLFCLFSHIFRASTGKERAAVDYSLKLSEYIGLKTNNAENIKLLKAIGISATFSFLFSSFFSGIIFAFENEKESKINFKNIILVTISSFLGFFSSRQLHVHTIAIYDNQILHFNLDYILMSFISALLILTCVFILKCLEKFLKKNLSFNLKNTIILSICFIFIATLNYILNKNTYPASLSLEFLSKELILNSSTSSLLFYIFFKILLTSISTFLGFKGGKFVVYAVIGALISGIAMTIFSNYNPTFITACSYATMAIGTNHILSSVVLCLELSSLKNTATLLIPFIFAYLIRRIIVLLFKKLEINKSSYLQQ